MNFDFRVPEIDAVVAALKGCSHRTILDVGCGRGAITSVLTRFGNLTATEYFPDSITEARSRCARDVRFVQSLPNDLPFPSRSFDTVVCTHVLDHLEQPQREQVLRELHRVLRPNGRLVITVLHQNFRFDKFKIPKEGRPEGVYRHHYYLEEFRRELTPNWKIEELLGVWTYLPKTYRLYTRLGRTVVYWERALRQTFLALRYGKMFLAVCRPNPS